MKSVMVVHDMAPTVLPTGNDEDGTRKLQILANSCTLPLKLLALQLFLFFYLNDQKIRNCKFQTNNERFNTYFNLQEQQRRETQF